MSIVSHTISPQNGDARLRGTLDSGQIINIIISHEAIFDFLMGMDEGKVSAAEALEWNWDAFKPRIELAISLHGHGIQTITTQMLNP
ncbi:hypothetical protein [Chromobacterium violaceum]|uniref:hypothetical protein n=1 Tax=Chromobacterium violaceum TaxID=536 RepID=UPI000A98746B|nr:hypothetical protein [Chromobacterium violaceum]